MGRIRFILPLLCTLLAAATMAQNTADFDEKMRQYGLVDIRSLDSEILVELKYATEDNFVGENMYGTLRTAYLLPHFARKVLKAQQLLQERLPNHTLLVYDAARPISVQRRMRKVVEGTEFEAYVADGTRGGRHNYGVAIDLTIADSEGKPLDMGSTFDFFGEAAWVGQSNTTTLEGYKAFVEGLVKRGVISRKAADNRIMLLEIMYQAGLRPYVKEWWHYQEPIAMPRTRELYRLLDF